MNNNARPNFKGMIAKTFHFASNVQVNVDAATPAPVPPAMVGGSGFKLVN